MATYDFQEIVEQLPLVVYVDELDERSSPLYISPKIATLLGYEPGEWLADPDLYVAAIHPEDRERVLLEIAKRNSSGTSCRHADYRMLSRDRRVVWIRDDEIVVDGAAHGYLQDVTEQRQALVRAELLASVLALAADELPPQEIIAGTADALAEALGEDVTVTYLDITAARELKPRYSTGVLPPSLPTIPEAIEQGPLVIDDILAEPWLEAAWPTVTALGIRSAVDVPLRRNGAIVGVLWFNTPEPRRWTGKEVETLAEVAAQLAVVLERSEEREQRVAAELDLDRRDSILEAVSRAAERLLSEPCWEVAVPSLLRELGDASYVSRAYLFEIVSAEGLPLRMSQRYEWVGPGIRPEIDDVSLQNLALAEAGLSRLECALTHHETFVANLSDMTNVERALFEPSEIRSILMVPIVVNDRCWGAIGFDDCTAEREWSAAETDALRTAASILAAAVGRQRSEASLREHEQKLRAVFDSALDAILVMDDERRLVDVNPAACDLFDRSRRDLVGLQLDGLRPAEEPGQLEARWKRLLQGDTIRDRSIVQAGGAIRLVEGALRPNFLPGLHVAFIRDVTDRKRLEAELLGSQKLESIGRLAGGVAHDFNNLLTAISGYTSLLLERTNGDASLAHDLGEIHRAAERAAELTHQLLAFGRRQVLQPRAVDLNQVLAETGSLLRRLLGEHVELVLRPGDGLGTVRVDPGQIEQVIVNLAVNSRDAMPRGGRLTITTREIELETGAFVELEFADTGIGMDEETRTQIFEPFFTTRAEGTGLGLASVHGIVHQSMGEVTVESEPGVGSVFRVRLPRISERPELRAVPATPSARKGSETILLVEDEDVVRALAQRVLERCGYTVLPCANGAEALVVAGERDRHIDLLLTDVVMPGLRGHEVAARVTATRPAIKVLYMSGYADEALLGVAAFNEHALIEKPFAVDALAHRVREALEA